jgi:hypothetical protein
MEAGDWGRLAVIVGMLARAELGRVIAAISRTVPVLDQIERGMLVPARALAAIDLRVLSCSRVRAEELARRVAAGLGIGFRGETRDESDARRVQVDYSRLLANVEVARARAEEWMREQSEKKRGESGWDDTYPPGLLKRKLQRLWQGAASFKGAKGLEGILSVSPQGAYEASPAGIIVRLGEPCASEPSPQHRLISEARAWATERVAELLEAQEARDRWIGRLRGSR